MKFHALASDFQASFSREADRFFFSPGRINLIGEHTDYTGGHVLPCAITHGTIGIVSERNDRLVRLFSQNNPNQGMIEFSLDELNFDTEHGWANYAKGMLQYIQNSGYPLTNGFDLLVSGNIPQRVGLASSASLLMLIGEIINRIYELRLDRDEIIYAGMTVETDYIGTHTGKLDFYPAAIGKEDHAIVLESHDLSYEYVPLHLEAYKIVIMNINKRDLINSSRYNQRRDECEHALRHLQGAINIQSLADLNMAQFENFQTLIPTENLRKRARHIVSENERTLAAVREIKKGNHAAFGKLINQSHLSLQNHLEVTSTEINTLVETAWKHTGTLGARMIGIDSGWAFAIVAEAEVDDFIEYVSQHYQTKMGTDPLFYVSSIGDGMRELKTGALR